ncbi:MAG TPA: hypothetical protein VN679_14625 [Candidatus Acidoferrales bacterium]|jgi:hypothetical protein|nr:hypothetical protein [Candidatus Angelobacter sp.]HWG89019.1 hypothetical protein [Candidatus Acidoferrales bacterium]
MERMEYDPDGPDYLPITEHETGSTFLVVGVIMLLAGLGWLLFVGWDIRGGNMFMQVIFAVDVLTALFLMVLGFMKKRRTTS